jgi:hypothetical protein
MIKYVERPVVKAIAVGKMIYSSGDPNLCDNGGCYYEGEYLFTGSDGKHYRCYFSSSEFDFCNLYGTYGSCESCPDGFDQWKLEKRVCLKCSDKKNCSFDQFLSCRDQFDFCQHPKCVFIEYKGRSYRALPIDD